MPLSSRELGRKLERMVHKHWEAQGYAVESGFKKVAWIKGRTIPITYDLFGSVDVIGVKDGTRVRMAQVTGGGIAARREKIFQTWEAGELWEWCKGRVFKIHRKIGEPELVEVGGR